MKKAFFIDRDGVVNSDKGHYYIYRTKDFVFNEDITEALQLIKEKGYLLVLITNQGGVAKKQYTEQEIEEVHSYMQSELAKENAQFDAIYYCPHHNEISGCNCRKPKPGMILKAIKDFNINPEQSYLIGDSKRDVEAGRNAGIKKTFQVKKNTSILELVKSIVNP